MTEYQVKPIDQDELRAARKAVARGVALLDWEGPDDWRERIVREQLDMGSTFRCILGQTFSRAFTGAESSGYDYGVQVLSQTDTWQKAPNASSEWFGFEQDSYDSNGEGPFNYPALGRAWEEVLFPELFEVTYEGVEDLIDTKLAGYFGALRQELPGLVSESVKSVLRSL